MFLGATATPSDFECARENKMGLLQPRGPLDKRRNDVVPNRFDSPSIYEDLPDLRGSASSKARSGPEVLPGCQATNKSQVAPVSARISPLKGDDILAQGFNPDLYTQVDLSEPRSGLTEQPRPRRPELCSLTASR